MQVQLICRYCNRQFTTYKSRRYHEKKYHEFVKDKKCYICGRTFQEASELRYHNNHFHLNPHYIYRCSSCHQSFRFHKELINHLTNQCHDRHQTILFRFIALLLILFLLVTIHSQM